MNKKVIPIETYYKGDKITKVCVENIHKIINRVSNSIQNSYYHSLDILDSIRKKVKNVDDEDYYIVGTGRSIPCITDPYDEEIGNNIAFMKAKLNANIKKHNLLVKVYNEVKNSLDAIDEELIKIDDYIVKDLNSIRMYNRDYLTGIEEKLGI